MGLRGFGGRPTWCPQCERYEIIKSDGVLSFPQVSNGRTLLAELQQYVSGCLHSGELRLGFFLTPSHCDVEPSFLVRRHRKELRD